MFKLYKQEGKLREMKPAPAKFDGEPTFVGYIETGKEYTANAEDWKDFEEGAEVKEFVLQHQWLMGFNTPFPNWADCSEEDFNTELASELDSRRIIARTAKPSAKENQGEEKKHEVAGLIKKYLTYVGNIQWHIDTNKPPEEEIKKLNSQIDHYTEIVNDLKKLSSYATQLKEENQRLREALEEIASPIKFMQERLKEGEKLDGMYAVMLSKDPHYLQSIATKALSK